MAGQQIAKRIPLIKFPDRRAARRSPAPAPGPAASTAPKSSESLSSSASQGTASIQPKRSSVSKEEIEAILLGGAVS